MRGALPLLAFARRALWERRDRERKLLTREAYQEIAGVDGRPRPARRGARWTASAPSGRPSSARSSATSSPPRARAPSCDREELLSVFPDRTAAEEVLRQLIDARLLTSYEVEGKEGEPSHHRVEIVHESLLKAWPRLVRWQAQDEEGAQLRDQLKQAAHLWEEKGRTADLLWTGTAYHEFELWRERYPGALTALEEDFAQSMAEKARRKRRLVRAAAAAAVLVSTGVAIAIAVSRHKAVVAAERAEASKLLALAELKLRRTRPRRSHSRPRAWSWPTRRKRGCSPRKRSPRHLPRGTWPGSGRVAPDERFQPRRTAGRIGRSFKGGARLARGRTRPGGPSRP